jgi:4-amino-4-deoxy-L-arabinose transferase-like glycosyltransferase
MTCWSRGVLVAAALAAGALRVTGWDRGASDFILPEASGHGETTSFYHYHPDETTLIGASLALDDPTQPPLTAYGTLPMYLGRAVLETTAWLAGEPTGSDALAVRSVRAVAALLSLATLATLWALARNLWGAPTALVAVLLVGAAPLAIQQAHFYTVDGLFALLALLSLGAVVQLHDKSRGRAYLAAGLLIGATAATRLNGLLTALVLAGAHFTVQQGMGWPGLPERFRARGLWYAALATVATVVVLQPHLLIHPASMLRSSGTDDFAYSMAIARGDLLRPWSLADTDTIPYLHFWTALWPQGVGWPLTVLLAAGWVYAVARGGRADRLIALWSALYFLSVGGLHTKHVRYLLPLLAPLGLLAARMVVDLCERRWLSRWVIAGIAACTLYTWAYGVAFTRIYRVEDVRITGGRWIHQQVPAGATIAIERGGFSMRGSFSAGCLSGA